MNNDKATPRHFLDLRDHSPATLRQMLDDASQMKRDWKAGCRAPQRAMFEGLVLAMIFQKPSTRTRISFEVAIRDLGGAAIVLHAQELQLGRGETIADTARILSGYVDAVMIRSSDHKEVLDLARHASIPVINGLTDVSHPCQLMADILTYEEVRGPIAGQKIAWVGDGNNVAHSWIQAAALFDFELTLAVPEGFDPDPGQIEWAKAEGASIQIHRDPVAAVENTQCVVTDTWISMGDDEAAARRAALAPYQVTTDIMSAAKSDAIFMHCLPAHRGEEVTADVIDGPASVVFLEAENRLHAQKAVLHWCLGGGLAND
ncbi:MAG: ornithine carbamoyltransferase [Rhizobiales bacterium]|nr:ornithine carbamoyltransferase [Hyphomicrobiales bacterium]